MFACILAFIFALYLFSGPGVDTTTFAVLTLIYIPGAALLPINTFLQLFHEANNKASHYSKIRVGISFIGAISLIIAFRYSQAENFVYYATSYFAVTEALSLLFLMTMNRQYRFISLSQARHTARILIKQGVPISLGTAGQKIYFYLILERLIASDISLAAQFTIVMAITNIIAIPGAALSQIHSLFASRNNRLERSSFHQGLIWISVMITAIMALFLPVADTALSIYSNGTVTYSNSLFLCICFFLLCNSIMSLTMAHLRARKDTLIPQLTVNVIMLLGVIPALYIMPWITEQLTTLILTQSLAILSGCIFLHGRIAWLHSFSLDKTCSGADQLL